MSLSVLMRATRPPSHTVWSEVRAHFSHEISWLEKALESSLVGAEEPVTSAIHQLIRPGGAKRVRPLLGWLLGNAVAEGRIETVHPIALTSELVHTATLLHDDVLDDAAVRRGVPAARILYGNRISVMAGDFVLTRALEVLIDTGDDALLRSFSTCVRQIVEGEVMQQRATFQVDVTEAAYREIVARKTGALFEWTTASAARIAGAREEAALCGRFGMATGIAFQILDDYLDWTGDETVAGKSVRADLREGKPSLAMILGCKASPWIRNWYLEHVRPDAPPPGAEDIAWIAGELEASGALRGVRQVLETEKNRALGLLADLPRTSGVKDVETFADLLLSSEFRV